MSDQPGFSSAYLSMVAGKKSDPSSSSSGGEISSSYDHGHSYDPESGSGGYPASSKILAGNQDMGGLVINASIDQGFKIGGEGIEILTGGNLGDVIKFSAAFDENFLKKLFDGNLTPGNINALEGMGDLNSVGDMAISGVQPGKQLNAGGGLPGITESEINKGVIG